MLLYELDYALFQIHGPTRMLEGLQVMHSLVMIRLLSAGLVVALAAEDVVADLGRRLSVRIRVAAVMGHVKLPLSRLVVCIVDDDGALRWVKLVPVVRLEVVDFGLKIML